MKVVTRKDEGVWRRRTRKRRIMEAGQKRGRILEAWRRKEEEFLRLGQ